MSTKHQKQRLLCVNCNICLKSLRRRRVFDLDAELISVISKNISPSTITHVDYICEECFNISSNANLDDTQAGSIFRGHKEVCLICGKSLLRRRSNPILSSNPSDLLQTMTQIIETRISPRQITPSDKLCHACWFRTKRDSTRQQTLDERRESNEKQSLPDFVHVDVPANSCPENVEDSSEYKPQIWNFSEKPSVKDNLPESSTEDKQLASNTITLPNYKRGPNSASRCAFAGCGGMKNLRRVSDHLRATIIEKHKFYIPNRAVFCPTHMQNQNWDKLYEAPNSISSFTAEQIEHIFSLIDSSKISLDFSSVEAIENIDDHLFSYWLGTTKTSFFNILRDLPKITDIKKGILGLAAVLIKMQTGDSDRKLSVLLKIPRQTLELKMKLVKEIMGCRINTIEQEVSLDETNYSTDDDPC